MRRLVFWGIANPMPNTRADRHGGNSRAIPLSSPADLYSNSTVALNPETGKLVWYYQHLPGDDWDLDYTNERVLVRTAVNPDPKFVKWINPDIPRNQPRDIALNGRRGRRHLGARSSDGAVPLGEAVPVRHARIPHLEDRREDGANVSSTSSVLVDAPGKRRTVCFWNTKSYWPMTYHPGLNSLFVPYNDNCLDMTAAAPASGGQPAVAERRVGIPRPGSKPDEFAGVAKINVATGEIQPHLQGTCSRPGRRIGDCGRPGVLGRSGPEVQSVRCPERRDGLGDDSRRNHPEQHHHLRSER